MSNCSRTPYRCSGEGEDTDGENRLDSNKQAEVGLPDDVQGREDLGSGQEDGNAEESSIDSLTAKDGQGQDFQEGRSEPAVVGNRLDSVGGADDEIARTDEEVRKLLEPVADTTNAVEHRVSKV